MSFGYVDFTVLVEYTRVAMSTSTMLIRNVHGTYPPHVAIRRSYIVFTYPIAIGTQIWFFKYYIKISVPTGTRNESEFPNPIPSS